MHSEKQCGTSIPGRSNWCRNITCSSMYPALGHAQIKAVHKQIRTMAHTCTPHTHTLAHTHTQHTHTHTHTLAHTHTQHTHTNFTSKVYRFCTVKAQVSASLVASRDMHYMRNQLIDVVPRGTHTTAARRLAPIRK